MDLLTQLTRDKLCKSTGCSLAAAEKWLLYFQVVLPAFEINTPQRVAAFLSQVGVESASLTATVENLNYSADGLANTWPIRYAQRKLIGKGYKTTAKGRYLPNALATKLARNPEAIANHCYANRMGNGTEASGDGWRYRGRGLKQLTGRDNYTSAAKKLGLDLVNNPDQLLEPAPAIISACWFWKNNELNRYADRGDIVGLTKAINGGSNGLQRRKDLYAAAMLALKD